MSRSKLQRKCTKKYGEKMKIELTKERLESLVYLRPSHVNESREMRSVSFVDDKGKLISLPKTTIRFDKEDRENIARAVRNIAREALGSE